MTLVKFNDPVLKEAWRARQGSRSLAFPMVMAYLMSQTESCCNISGKVLPQIWGIAGRKTYIYKEFDEEPFSVHITEC